MSYEIRQLNNDTYLIKGKGGESTYLLVGETSNLLIDTGMQAESLKEVLYTIDNKKIDVVLTHGHIDHVGRCGEFENVYIDYKDLDIYKNNLQTKDGFFDTSKLCFKEIDQLKEVIEEFDLGNKKIKVVKCYGHTQGSIILLDQVNKTAFFGDAIGSGAGVLMCFEDSLILSEYKKELTSCLNELKSLGVDMEYKFYGGHDGQEKGSKAKPNNYLDIELLEDMIGLCAGLLANTIQTEKINLPIGNIEALYARYNRAEMMFRESIVK